MIAVSERLLTDINELNPLFDKVKRYLSNFFGKTKTFEDIH